MNKQKLLQICIDEVLNGKSSVEDCIARYPELEKDLLSILKIAKSLKPDDVTPSPEFKERVKAHLFDDRTALIKESSGFWSWPRLVQTKVLTSVLIGLLAIGIAGGSTVYAAQRSLPGDTLYPVKTVMENLQVAITPGVVAKTDLRLKLVQRRIDETNRQIKSNRNINAQVAAIGQQLDEAIKELSISGNKEATGKALSRLSTTTLDQQLEIEKTIVSTSRSDHPVMERILSIMHRANIIAQTAYSNRDFLARRPSVTDEKMESGQFNLTGVLLSVQGSNWNVGGVFLNNVVFSGVVPPVGSQIRLEGLVKNDEVFISQIELTGKLHTGTTIEGRFGGKNPDGTANISGIPVDLNDTASSHLETGDDVTLQGTSNSGIMNIKGKVTLPDNYFSGIRLRGVLTEINPVNNQLKVKIAGNQITIDVSEARIVNESDRLFNLSDINRAIGRNVRLYGIYKKDNRLFARQVQVEIEN